MKIKDSVKFTVGIIDLVCKGNKGWYILSSRYYVEFIH